MLTTLLKSRGATLGQTNIVQLSSGSLNWSQLSFALSDFGATAESLNTAQHFLSKKYANYWKVAHNTISNSSNKEIGDESKENLFASRDSNTLSRTARLACIGFKEREFSLGSGPGAISIFSRSKLRILQTK